MDAGVAGGAFLSAFLQVLFDRLASHEVVEFLSGRNDIDDLLKMLKIKLLSANTVLDDAETKQLTKPAVKIWLEELKDVIYHAEDLLDEIETEALRCKVKDTSQSNTSQWTSMFSPSVSIFEKRMTTEMKKIIQRVEFIINEKDSLGLKVNTGHCQLLPRIPTTSLVDDSGIYGRDGDKEALMNMLVSDAAPFIKTSVLAILGMGGVGKSTLAQLLYNDDRVDQLFDFKAWVCVSEEFDITRIIKEILEAVGGLESFGSASLNQLQGILKARLTGKKFCIVLDDVWTENYLNWEALGVPLRYGARGSKIIITTPSKRVATVFAFGPIYSLKQLTDEDCWQLFAKHAYDGEDFLQPDQELTGRKIAKMCQGLPLAAKALGTFLRSKYAPSEWNNLLESDIWELIDKDSSIIPTLQLSYHYLPSHLKRCFAYCSIFPNNFELKKKQLIQLWMAENLLQQNSEFKRFEDIGDEYFNDLVSLSFFQQSRGSQQNFVMHDHL